MNNVQNQNDATEQVATAKICYTTRLDYDDNVIDIVEKISDLLKHINLQLQFDGKEHEGFEIIELKEVV